MLRPVAHAGATVALAGAAVSGYLVAAPTSAPQTGAVDELSLRSERVDAVSAASSAAEDASAHAELVAFKAGTPSRLAAQAAATAAAAAEAARLEAERAAAAERAARDAQRAAALANAQANPKAAAQALVAQRGWNDAQFQCLVRLWTEESNWNYRATNRSSGAYGIPQSLPGSKMASAGADWRTNPVTQITWGLGYIAGRYGTPCGAWAHSQSYNWY